MILNHKQKILIIQTAFLGDTILSLPLVQSLKNIIPECEIDYLCIPSTANVLENNPNIHEIIRYNKKGRKKIRNLIKMISFIKERNYDIIVCPHRSLRSALITYFSKARIRIGFNKNVMSFLLTGKAKYLKNEHEIKRNLELIKLIPGIEINDKMFSLKPELFPSADDKNNADELLNKFITDKDRMICFAPCSKWFTKNLPEKISIDILNSLNEKGFNVALLGGIEDEKFCRLIEGKAKDKNKVFCLAGNLTPLQSSYVIQRSCALITVDSAAAHIGASTNKPIVMIFGSTVPAFGFYPLTSKNIIIENNNLDCRPCTDHGRGSCPKKHFKCMIDLKTTDIINAVDKLLYSN